MRAVWESVRVQVLQRQTPEIHSLCGPRRQEIPVSFMYEVGSLQYTPRNPNLRNPDYLVIRIIA